MRFTRIAAACLVLCLQTFLPAQDTAESTSTTKSSSAVTQSNDNDKPTDLSRLEQAVSSNPNDVALKYDLAMAYLEADQLPKMWRILRAGAAQAPSHEGIARGLLSYWRMFDQQGLFNVGNPAADVVRVLGEPDQRADVGGRDRLVYGFLAVDCDQDRVHQTIDLRGLTAEHFQPSEIVDLEMDGRGRRVGSRTVTRFNTLAEFVLPSEKVQDWTELFSVQRLHRLAAGGRSMKDVAIELLDILAKSHPERQFRFIDESDESVLYEWKVKANENTKAQHELVRLMRGKADVHRVSFVVRADEIPAPQRETWIGLLRAAKLREIPARTKSTRPPAKTNKLPEKVLNQTAWELGGTLSVAVFAHASGTAEVAKKKLVESFQLCNKLGVTMPRRSSLATTVQLI